MIPGFLHTSEVVVEVLQVMFWGLRIRRKGLLLLVNVYTYFNIQIDGRTQLFIYFIYLKTKLLIHVLRRLLVTVTISHLCN